MKIATIVGARPQFIKAAMISRALKSIPGTQEVVIHTGQHYDSNMSDIFFGELKMAAPHINLKIREDSHGAQTGQMLSAIEAVLKEQEPDCVLVYGDTNSTLAGALAAAKLHQALAHVEAGLRSFNRRMPEEINRVVTDHLADLLFAPTRSAVCNLRREGIAEENTFLVGDVMYDAALYYGSVAERTSTVLDRLSVTRKRYFLATIHRAENSDSVCRIRAILGGLAEISKQFPVVIPVHPRTRRALLGSADLQHLCESLILTEPVGYLDMLMLEKNAVLIATDSGGVQKEAFFHRVPSVTLRDETEWVELTEMGWTRIVPPNSAEEIAEGIRRQLDRVPNETDYTYGDGHSAEQIVAMLSARLKPRVAAAAVA